MELAWVIIFISDLSSIRFLRLPASPTKTGLYFVIMAQEKRETRFCQVHQTIGIAKHPLRNELKKQIPHARFYPNKML